MSESKKTSSEEFRTSGILTDKSIQIVEQSSIDALTSRGYGSLENKVFSLTYFEALYLLERGMLEVKSKDDSATDFQTLLHLYEERDENAWANYLVYRDLRSRGYVVREGFGGAMSFRVYERGAYGKDTAPYLILGVQEGKPLTINEVSSALQQCQSQKKELILAVMNRRGEIVHYSVGEMHLTV